MLEGLAKVYKNLLLPRVNLVPASITEEFWFLLIDAKWSISSKISIWS